MSLWRSCGGILIYCSLKLCFNSKICFCTALLVSQHNNLVGFKSFFSHSVVDFLFPVILAGLQIFEYHYPSPILSSLGFFGWDIFVLEFILNLLVTVESHAHCDVQWFDINSRYMKWSVKVMFNCCLRMSNSLFGGKFFLLAIMVKW